MRKTLINLAVLAAMQGLPGVFRCTHCRKDDHTDTECWSTRQVYDEWAPIPQRVWGEMRLPPAP